MILTNSEVEILRNSPDPKVKALVNEKEGVYIEEAGGFLVDGSNYIIQRRMDGEYRNKGFFLAPNYKWDIVTDSHGAQVLVPRKKC